MLGLVHGVDRRKKQVFLEKLTGPSGHRLRVEVYFTSSMFRSRDRRGTRLFRKCVNRSSLICGRLAVINLFGSRKTVAVVSHKSRVA